MLLLNLYNQNYQYWAQEYFFLKNYLIIVICFVLFLWILVINLSHNSTLFEKTSQYECGFEPFGTTTFFDMQYFLIALLYLIFDVELVLIMPWLLSLSNLTLGGLLSMFLFMLLLIVGLVYEWKKNVLHWT